ncbi:RICIN domain-containing protein [Streptomyces solaniscabiei]|uniref:RICIN domain-containing protein n=1 Tax=Streptomyces solaniscabiei TaxID=2683255 RepID=UPI001CE39CE7|nr:RICIN domain-containing protein [Streptomyces solaniscabiei]
MPVGFGDLLFGVPLAAISVQKRFNEHRAAQGKLPLFIDTSLATAANRHTTDMSLHHWMVEHWKKTDPQYRDPHVSSDNVTRPKDRIIKAAQEANWRPEEDTTGEILQWGGAYLNTEKALHFWLVESPAHEAVVSDARYTHMGFSASHNDAHDEWMYGVTFAKSTVRPLISINSGLALDVKDVSTANGAPIHQWPWWGGNNQKFRMEPTSNGYVRLVAVHSGKVLDVKDVSTANGTPVHQWEWWGGGNQQFLPEVYVGDIKLTARHSGRVLEIRDFSTVEGGLCQQWDWLQGSNQRWKF